MNCQNPLKIVTRMLLRVTALSSSLLMSQMSLSVEYDKELSGTENGEQLYIWGDTNDHIMGLGGDDQILGLSGDDWLEGGSGNDKVWGDEGNDILEGGDDDDQLYGGAENDVLNGGEGNDDLQGESGQDQLVDLIGNNRLWGGNDNDTLETGPGEDYLDGGEGNDNLKAGAGNDNLRGGLNADTLEAGSGDDDLVGGAGNDTLTGGEGNDTYIFYVGDGQDTINNYDTSGTDVLYIQEYTSPDTVGAVALGRLSFIKIGSDLEIRIDSGAEKIRINDWFVSSLHEIELLNGGYPSSYLNTLVVDETDTGGGDSNQAPIANAGSDQSVEIGDTVTLDPNSSSDPDGDDLTYAWSLLNASGITLTDGAVSNTKQFTAPNVAQTTTITFELTVTDSEGLSNSDTVNIQINAAAGPNLPPVVDLGSDQSVVSGDTVSISLANVYDPDGSLASNFYPQFIEGTPQQLTYVSIPSSLIFTAPEVVEATVFTLRLTFYDDLGASSYDDISITVNPSDGNKTPSANAGDDQVVSSLSSVVISSNGSSDPDGDELTHEWTVTSGHTLNFVEWQHANSFVFVAPLVTETETIELTLRVTDSGGLYQDDTLRITVNPATELSQIPIASAGHDITVTSGHTVELDGSNSFDPDYEAITLEWQVVDSAFELTQGSRENSVQFIAPSVLTQTVYSVQLTATDGSGASFTDTTTITVNPDQQPDAQAGSDQWVTQNSKVVLDARQSTDPNGQTLTFTWLPISSGDFELTSGVAKGVVEFIAPVTDTTTSHEFELTVTTEDGRTNKDTVVVQVSPDQAPLLKRKPIADVGPDLVVEIGDTVSIDYSASHDPDGGYLNSNWSWSYPFEDIVFLDSQILEFTAPNVTDTTTFVLQVVVTDSDGLTDTDYVRVTVNGTSGQVQNFEPVVSAGKDQTVNIGDLVVLDASQSKDPEFDSFSITWSSITDENIVLNTGANPNIISFTAPDTQYTKNFRFKVSATDSQNNEGTDEVTVRVLGREDVPDPLVPAADVIVVMDESGSMAGEQLWIGETILPLQESLLARGIGDGSMQNRFGLVGFGPNAYFVKSFLVGGEQYGSAFEFVTATEQLQTEGGLEDGWLALSHALDNYPHRGASALNVILVTDADRDIADASVDYDSVLAKLKSRNALLNAVVYADFYCGDGREAIGMDATGLGYLADGQGGYKTCTNAHVENTTEYEDAANTVADYVDMALASGGAAWNVIELRKGGSFAESFTQAIIKIKTQEIATQQPQGKYQAIAMASPMPATPEQVITLDGSLSKVVDGELAINKYEWDLDLDGKFETEGMYASVSYSQSGVYPVRLRVSNDGAGINSDIVTIDLIVADAELINRPSVITSEPVTHVVDTQSYSYQLVAEDQHSNVTYKLVTKINGMTIDNTTGEIVWPNPIEGEYEVIVQAMDEEGLTDTQIFTLTVSHINLPPQITSAHRIDAYENAAYEYQVHAWDPEYETLMFTLDAAPDRMTIDPVTGVINWNPLIDDIGTHPVTVTVKDPWGLSDTQTYTLIVHNVNDGPDITSDANLNAIEDSGYAYSVLFSDLDLGIDLEEAHVFTLDASPAGMVIDSVTGEIAWMPTNDQVGNHNVTVKVTDFDGLYDIQTYTVTVANVNDAPVITSTEVTQVNERANYYYNVDADDIDAGDKLTYSLITAPAGMSINGDSGAISWVPEIAQIGTHTVTVSVKDIALAEDTQAYLITVKNVDDAPKIITAAIKSIDERAAYQYDVDATDLDVGEVLVYSLTEQPTGMSINSITGLITWTPTSDQLGYQPVKVLVTDSDGLTDTQNYSVQVLNVNDAPEFTTDPILEINERANYYYDADAQDQDPSDSLTYSLQSGPSGLSVNSYYGRVTWTPTSDQLGDHQVVLVVTDRGGLTDTQTYTIKVNNVDDAPDIISTAITTIPERETYTYDVNATDIDIGEVLTYSLNDAPSGMSINDATGVITWLTAPENIGSHRVEVQVTDKTNLTDKQSFYLSVTDVNEPPSITTSAVTAVNEYESYTYDVNATDPDPSESLRFSLVSAPEGMSVNTYNGYISWTPNATHVGDNDVVVRVTDKGGLTDDQAFTITVANKEFAPVFVSSPVTSFYLGESYYYYAALATDKDLGEVLTYSLVEKPDGMSIDSVTGAVNWMPLDSQQGNQRVSILVTDSTDLTATQTFNVNVIGIIADDLAFTTDENVALDIQLLANNLTAGDVTYTISQQPTNGTIIGEGQNIVYLPNKHYEGEETFQFRATNEYSVYATATVTISVIGKNDPPYFVSEPITRHVIRDGFSPSISMNFTDWEHVSLTGSAASGWKVEDDGRTALQVMHSNPSSFIGSFDMENTMIEGLFEVYNGGDDDFIGFILGYQNNQQHYLLDWKQNYQGAATRGLTLKKYDNPPENGVVTGDYWGASSSTFEQLYYNDIARLDLVEYKLHTSFINGNIKVRITNAGELVDEFEVNDDSFTVGRFGLYMHSQQYGRFKDFKYSKFGDNKVYYYPAVAEDPEGGLLSYRLVDAPVGMTIDENTGEIQYITNTDTLGVFRVSIEVEDDIGQTALQSYDLVITNDVPVIVSQPETTAEVARPYTFTVTAFDPNAGDTLTFALVEGPAGMMIDASTGVLHWLPMDGDLGSHNVSIEVADQDGNVDRIRYVLEVSLPEPNEVPVFTSTPVFEAIVGRQYNYLLQAFDPEGEVVQFFMGDYVPQGMQMFDGETVTWVPTADQIQDHHMTFIAADPQGGLAEQHVIIRVKDLSNNEPPVINSVPESQVVEGETYTYQVEATDSNGDAIEYFLDNAPMGMTINKVTGLVSWESSALQGRVAEIRVVAMDINGAKAIQTFGLVILPENPNAPPTITSVPSTLIAPDEAYEYQVVATDPEGEALTYELVTAPVGMSMDVNGLVNWAPTLSDLGKHEVVVSATDPQGALQRQIYQLTITNTNANPQITSSPNSVVAVNSLWEYQATATDADGDFLTWKLANAQTGMNITSTGLFSWIPPMSWVGQTVTFDIIVEDGRGGQAVQTLNVPVNYQANDAPVITSTPTYAAQLDAQYSYQVTATDAEGDDISYSLTVNPEGASMNDSGLVSWTPAADQVGAAHSFKVIAQDALGGQSIQTFQVAVNSVPSGNELPKIVSSPVAPAIADVPYEYQVIAKDANSDALTYELITAPTGMTIDANGLIKWQATLVQEGQHAVTVRASDQGGYTQQSYVLPVIQLADSTNQYPEITSTPVYVAAIGNTYQYQVLATDADGDALSYELVSGPTGMTMDSDGLITWAPTNEQMPKQSVELKVSDALFYATQTFDVTVRETPLPLEVNIQVNPTVVTTGQEATITVFAQHGLGAITRELWIDGQPITLDQYGSATFSSNVAGSYDVMAKATDQQGEETTQAVLIVTDVYDPIPPVVDLSAIEDLDVVTAPVDIIATIEEENLIGWRVIVKEVNSAPTEYQVIATGTGTTTNGVLTTFDPTMLINGQYHIIVEATDVNNNVTQNSVTVRVEGDLKVGNFSITLQDMNIPLAGIPIQVSRTYDSRQKHKLMDFGYGWSVDYQNIKVEESRKPGKGWAMNEYPGFMGILKDYCVEPLGSPVVTITLPDGQQESFEAEASPKCNKVYPALDVSLTFKPMDDTQSELEPLNNSWGRLVNGDVIDMGGLFDALNPSRYKLTTRNGFVYVIDEAFGVETITDPNGNIITYSDNGIVHSSGKSIDFVRNDDGVITQVIDPQGNVTSYEYETNFDLKSVTDAENASATYTYNSQHGLVDMLDPLGRKLVKNIYDNSGRLIAQEDGDGNRTDFDHDIDGRQSVVTDRLGNQSFIYYDDEGYVTAQVDALGNTTNYTYDANGNQTSKVDAFGRETKATFNDRNDQLTATDALGNTVSYSYNKLGKELTITDASGDVYNNTYDSFGNLLKVVDPLGKEVSNNINSQGLPSLVRDALGNDTTYTYDDDGNKLTETNALDVKTTYTYDDNGNVLTETQDRTLADNSVVSETTTYEYDKRNRVVKTTYSDGTEARTEYDLNGNETAMVDAKGRRTTMEYDLYGRVTKTTYPDNTTDTKTYDAEGNVLTQTDRAGNTTEFEYDALNRVVKTTAADGGATQTEYDAVGQVTAQIDALGNRTTFEYDLAGRRTKTTDALGNEHQFDYDVDGNLVKETDALGHITTYVYDKLDRKVETLFHNASSVKTGLDALGRKVSATDQAAMVTQFEYDKLGRLTKVISPKADPLDDTEQANETSYTYDEAGNKLTQTDAEGRTTRWTYDAMGRVLTRTLPLGQVETFTYDVIGNVQTRTDFNGNLITYAYDDNDRVTSITYAQDNSVETFSYDDLGNRLTATHTLDSHTRTWAYTYDVMSRLKTETQPNGDQLAYTYDVNGNKTELTITYANGDIRVERFTYDALNRLKTVKDAAGNLTTYEYDTVGNRSKVTHSNANITNYVYDELNRLTQLQTQAQDDTVLQQFDYTLHTTGRREIITELSGRHTDYTYDHLYRLVKETITDAVNGDYSAEYQFDKVGNRTYQTINGVSTALTYDDNDRITQQGGTTYTYDDNGNTLTESLDSDVTTYTYNGQNKLIAAEKQIGETTTNSTYQYNVDGIRIAQSINDAVIKYIVDSNRPYQQVIAEAKDDNSIQVEHTYGEDLLSQTRDNELSNYHYDGLGSTRALSNSTGALTDTYDYEAYGEVLNRTGITENNYQYTGEQYDANLDQYYLRARYYDQASGRLTQQDTWMGEKELPLSLNKYIYAYSDSANFIDPTGNMGIAGFMVNFTGVSIRVGHRTVVRHAFKNIGCELGVALAEQSITHGIYLLFDSVSGRYYVGQSTDIDRRYKQHLKEAERKARSAWKANSKIVARFFVDGGSGALDKVEQFIIDMFEQAGHSLHNDKSVIGPDRKKLRGELNQLKKALCK